MREGNDKALIKNPVEDDIACTAYRMDRRSLLSGLAAVGTLASVGAHAETYPTHEIKFVCGFAAGGGADLVFRYLAQRVEKLAGKPVIVDNKPGAGGHIATALVANSKPNGYTVSSGGGTGFAYLPFLYKTPAADPLKDFDYLGTVLKQSWYLVVDEKSPIKSISELTRHLKDKQGKGLYGTSTNIGTAFAEMYKVKAGVEAEQVSYKSIADAFGDLSSGKIDFLMVDPPFAIGGMQNGRMRALAVSTGKRIAATPDIPTMEEAGVPGIDLTVWWSLHVAAGTPLPIREQLAKWFNEVLKTEETRVFFAKIGSDVFLSTPEETRAYLVKDIENWREYVRIAKLPQT
jgi:tripartite-type tricarboxylate transporter receptor subunit TctC